MTELKYLEQYYRLSAAGSQIMLKKIFDLPQDMTEIYKAIETLAKHRSNTLHLANNQRPIYSEVLGVDIETTSLTPQNGDIRLISIARDSGTIVTNQVPEVAEILADKSILKVFHNAAFDVGWLREKGYMVNSYADTMVMNQVIENRANGGNSLRDVVNKYLGVRLDKSLQMPENWWGELTEDHKNYCLNDAKSTLALYFVLVKEIESRHLEVVLDRELGALDTIIELNNVGILFDFAGWNQELGKMASQCEGLSQQIKELLESPALNLQSPAQIIKALRNKGIEVEGTSDEILARYTDQFEVISLLRRYKKLRKQCNSFGEKLTEFIGPDGRLRGSWRLIGTDTSRMTCSNPNIQGMPGISKKYFHAPSGCSLISADYSNIELRILAEITRDPELMSAFINGEDLHNKTARAVLGKADDESISPGERKIGKVINFGLIYGMTKWGLQKKINAGKTTTITLEQAAEFRDRYFDLYKDVLTYQDQMLKSDFIQTLGGRYWGKESSELKQGAISRFNYPIQASGAEGLKESLYLLQQAKKPDWRIVAVIHDEIVLEVPGQDITDASVLLKQCMIEGMRKIVPNIPLEVDINVAAYWCKT